MAWLNPGNKGCQSPGTERRRFQKKMTTGLFCPRLRGSFCLLCCCSRKLRGNSNGGASLDTGRIVNPARDCLSAGGHQGESVRKGVRASISSTEVIVGGEKRGWIRAGEMHRTVDDCVGLAVDGCGDCHGERGTGRCARRSRKLQNCVRVSATT